MELLAQCRLRVWSRAVANGGKLPHRIVDHSLDAFIDAVLQNQPLLTDAEDAVKQMRVIDAVYEAAGLPKRGSKP